MNNLYRGAYEAKPVESSFTFDDAALKKALKRIYEKDVDVMNDIEENLFNAVFETMSGAVEEGFGVPEAGDHFGVPLLPIHLLWVNLIISPYTKNAIADLANINFRFFVNHRENIDTEYTSRLAIFYIIDVIFKTYLVRKEKE